MSGLFNFVAVFSIFAILIGIYAVTQMSDLIMGVMAFAAPFVAIYLVVSLLKTLGVSSKSNERNKANERRK